MRNDDEAAIQKAEQFCRERGINPGFRFVDSASGPSVFSRIGGTGRLICHPEDEPDMQSSWAMTPEAFAKAYLDKRAGS